jgi:O-antigen/teichoic acid export membrane protein
MAMLLIGVIWFAPEIINIMAGKEYDEAKWVVAPVAMSLLLLFYSQLFINVEFYYEEKRSLVFASIGSMIVNVVLNFIFIPQYGFVVAGYTTWCSYIIFAYANYYAMKKIFNKKNIEDNLYNYKALIGIMVIFTVLGFVGVALYKFLVIRIVFTCIGAIVILINRGKLLAVYKAFRKG